jgi:DNA replication and repair protein RecF
MYLTHLHLKSFRNFEDQIFEFGRSFNILVGDNAQGKTNVLEAISLLCAGSSFRTSEWRDMIAQGRGAARVAARLESERGSDELVVELGDPRKKFIKNGKNTTPGGFAGLHAVLFAPEEILLLRTQPGARRKFIDTFVSSFVPGYKKLVRDYSSVVSQRNKILSDDALTPIERKTNLLPWNEQLIQLGTRVVVTRNEWISKINETLPSHYGEIAVDDGEARFHYKPHSCEAGVASDAQAVKGSYEEALENRARDEWIRGVTLVGPHRDDLVAHIGSGPVKRFASQGQHRSFVLALKVAEMEVYRSIAGEEPLLLLDDVASELDPNRNRRFFDYVRGSRGQVFITTTQESDVKLTPNALTIRYGVERGSAKRLTQGPIESR